MSNEDEDEKPLDPVMENVRKKMVRLLLTSLGIMMVGLMAVLGAIVYKINSGGDEVPAVRTEIPSDGAFIAGNIVLPKGAWVNGHSLSGGRITLDVTLQGGAREILLFDMASQTFVARFALKEE